MSKYLSECVSKCVTVIVSCECMNECECMRVSGSVCLSESVI